jgi:hypothetical protein
LSCHRRRPKVDAAEPDAVAAKFSKKKRELTITLTQPLAAARLCGDLE